ncbi:LPS export ABC transporter periplasmic protein LptC [Sphingomonas canadensis]|uniref:LPS export ABC transporter periplasmic protein LptC n=1 Tax=Sphingomonas canadensis TaxID=1219257 RepID=A0ABW3H1A0_9SPHN|nr:LPS export ABC transporter periplasmic protein LptC [Sphingomonas canadensis]MCW3835166.1 LPS export ABC transporter periplasmic protein LptC [Sphingomonas canadensis]
MSEVAERLQDQRRARAHTGSAHDRIVHWALIILPAGIGILAAFLVLSPLFAGGDVSFVLDKNRVDVASERLRIQAAEYRGEDSKGRPFRLRAGSAVQKSSSEPVVQLHQLSAEIKMPEGPATLKANDGRYDMERQQVAIDGPIRFEASDGYTLDTRDATVDLKTRRVASGGAASGTTPMGTFSGDKMSADLESRVVSLDGNARLRIFPRRANRR